MHLFKLHSSYSFILSIPARTHKSKFASALRSKFSFYRKEMTQRYRMLIFVLNIAGDCSRAGAEPGASAGSRHGIKSKEKWRQVSYEARCQLIKPRQ